MKRAGRYPRNRKSNAKKERMVMITCSAFVLAALTMTGVYVKNSSESNQNDGYTLDMESLERNATKESEADNNTEHVQTDDTRQESRLIQNIEDDLDYSPMEQPVGSGDIEIPGLTAQTVEGQTGLLLPTDKVDETGEEEKPREQPQAGTAQETKTLEADFAPGDTLVWPVSGNVLIPYSMDKTVYFSTLAQYKYNPALILAAGEGDAIYAAAGGNVTSVFTDDEIGNAVTVEIGNGYEVTYGQLKDISVKAGSYVEKGSIIGYVAQPTKYYSVEGVNAYFALTLNGEPADPMGALTGAAQ